MTLNLRSRLAMLCTVLLLWQVGVAPLAHAGAAHAVEAATSQVAEAEVAMDAAAMPCHGHEGAPTAGGRVADHETAHAAEMPAHDGGLPDCCQSFDCQCPCAHASLGMPAMSLPSHRVPDHPTVLGQDLPIVRARVVDLFKPPI
jgi:hypothetical protein